MGNVYVRAYDDRCRRVVTRKQKLLTDAVEPIRLCDDDELPGLAVGWLLQAVGAAMAAFSRRISVSRSTGSGVNWRMLLRLSIVSMISGMFQDVLPILDSIACEFFCEGHAHFFSHALGGEVAHTNEADQLR